jgi:hypothetical protein
MRRPRLTRLMVFCWKLPEMRKYACDCSEAMLVFIEKAMSILLKDGRPAHVGMVQVRGFAIGFISSRQGTPGFESVACSTFALHCPGCQCCDEILPRNKISLLGEAR